MHSHNLENYFKKQKNNNWLDEKFQSILFSINPEYIPAFESYRKNILANIKKV